MKRFIIIIAAVAGFVFSANAQTYYDDGELSVSRDTFCLNGMPLDDGQVLDLLGKEVQKTFRAECGVMAGQGDDGMGLASGAFHGATS